MAWKIREKKLGNIWQVIQAKWTDGGLVACIVFVLLFTNSLVESGQLYQFSRERKGNWRNNVNL
jgi:hypothetical protein